MTASVAIVGAGMVGVCTALYLQREGFRVVVIDPNPPGSGSSYGNAGCISPSSVVPMAMPGVLRDVPSYLLDPNGPLAVRWRYLPVIAPWLWHFVRSGSPAGVEKQAQALASLLQPAFDLLAPLLEAAGAEDLIRRDGHLYAYRSAEGFAHDRGGWALRKSHGVSFEVLRGSDLAAVEPALASDFHCGVLIKGNGHIVNPQALVLRLMAEVERNGGQHRRARAIGFRVDAGRLAAVETDMGDVRVQHAVIAAGAHSRPLAAALGDRVRLDTERGYHLMLLDADVQLRLPVLDAERKVFVTPMEQGLRLAGTVELAGYDAPPNWARARSLLHHASSMLPGLRRSYPDSQMPAWMGFRPSMPDSLPVIAHSRATRDVVYAFGHGHVGMTASPMTARTVASMVAGVAPPIDIAPFRVDRF